MSGQEKLNGPEVKKGGRKILFTQITFFARLFNSSRNGRSIVGGYVKFFNNESFFFSKVKPFTTKNPDTVRVLILSSFRKLIFIYFIRSHFFCIEIKPSNFHHLALDVLQYFHHFAVKFTANAFALFKESSHKVYLFSY